MEDQGSLSDDVFYSIDEESEKTQANQQMM